MSHTLKGDRETEYGFLAQHIPLLRDGLVLDLGCGPNASGAQIALQRGYAVVGIDLEPCGFAHPRFTFIQSDFLKYDFGPILFDFIINVSTMEHFGIAGRYGVMASNPTADVRGMQKLLSLIKPGGTMVLTIPIGIDTIISPLHRIYGRDRLPTLTLKWRALASQFYGKRGDVDDYVPIDINEAFATRASISPSYYAIGCFHLCRAEDVHLLGKEKMS